MVVVRRIVERVVPMLKAAVSRVKRGMPSLGGKYAIKPLALSTGRHTYNFTPVTKKTII